MIFPEMRTQEEKSRFFHGLRGNEKIEALNEMVHRSNRIVFFGGAGVSTESGIPDFRSKDGLYNQRDVKFDHFSPEYLLSDECLYQHPDVFFEFYRQKLDTRNIQPNAAHRKLAELEAAGKLSCVVTQNIDGLHQKAGSKKVYEIHGTTLTTYCTGRKRHDLPSDFIFQSRDSIPNCPKCGAMVRPDVVLYGEGLPDGAYYGAMTAIRQADMLIIGGTSLTVYPAAGMVDYFGGPYLVIINRDVTDKDNAADLVFHESIGEVLDQIKVGVQS